MKMIGCSSLRFHFMLITYLVILSSVTAPVNAQTLNKPGISNWTLSPQQSISALQQTR